MTPAICFSLADTTFPLRPPHASPHSTDMRIRPPRGCWLVTVLLVISPLVFAEIAPVETARQQQAIQSTVDVFKTGDIEAFAKKIQFPLARRYPLPSVNNAQELRQRYADIFDSHLGKVISASNAKTDWESVGWRGYMLSRGLVWADEAGLITAINYESSREKNLRAALIDADRKALHESLRSFDEPVLKWDTSNYRLRIDAQGKHYRLTLWPAGRSFQDKPELIIERGTLTFDGSGGNHHYSFPFGQKTYVCDVEVLGSAREPHIGSFDLLLDGKTISSEDALRGY